MASSMIDSLLYRNNYSTPELREIFDDRSIIQNWMDFETALAETQAEYGIIPKEAAEEIARKAKVENLNIKEIEQDIMKVGHSLVPVLRAVEHLCENGWGEYIHLGATTQDILDTGFMMAIKKAFLVILRDAYEIERMAADLADKYADTVMIGRTHGQQALPITFGYKAAVWASEISRDIDRMEESLARDFCGELSGAVGSMASFGESALEITSKSIQKVGLDVPDIAWHASRDRMVSIVNILALFASTLGRIGHECVCMQKTEFGEVAEGFKMGNVGSSTMPHKRNPNVGEALQNLGRIAIANASCTYNALYLEHERDGAAWKIEWKTVNETLLIVGGAAAKAKRLLSDLRVDEKRMLENLNLTHGLLYSEAVMLALGQKIGKQTAHEVVYEISMDCFEKGVEFIDGLCANETVAGCMTRAELEKLMDPYKNIGECGYFAHAVANAVRAKRIAPKA